MMGTLPPGVYTFTIAAIGQNSQIETGEFTWTLIDPCTPQDIEIELVTEPEDTDYPIGIGDIQIYFPTYQASRPFCTPRLVETVQRDYEWDNPAKYD